MRTGATTTGRPCRDRPPVTISDWKPLARNTLRGFLTAHLPSGMTLHEVSVHTRDGTWWVSPGSKPMVAKDGTALRDDAGKIRYSPVVSFESKTARQRFNAAIVNALQRAHPEIFSETQDDDGLPRTVPGAEP